MNFKKLSITLAASLLLTGCTGSANTSESVEVLEDGEYVVSSLTDRNFTAYELYESIVSTSTGESAIFEAVIQTVMDENYPITDDMELDADLIIEQIEESYYYYYGEDWESELVYSLVSSGFYSVDDYRESLVLSLQYSAFLSAYVDENYDEVLADYIDYCAPRFLSIIMVSVADMDAITEDEQATLDEVTALVNSTKEFSETATEYSYDTSASSAGSIGLIDNMYDLETAYGTDVQTAAFALSEGEYTSEPVAGDSGYYFIKCDSFDETEIDEYIQTLGIDTPLISYDSYMLYEIYNSYELTYEDAEMETIVNTVVETQLAAKAELRGEE
ncbi:peptidylprolyl isomerase [Tannockella kyphosi]|uniref:peptidylprolyl isomerase n=1 Tax=Tannockella kyphosi TaxID=2899121 RepID=UPI002011836B|nr:peptidylprolyl isomerase [Tannockella kyphosi]